MFKKVPFLILGLPLILVVLLVYSLPVAAHNIPITSSVNQLSFSSWEPGVTDSSNLEITIISDQEQIRKELESIGIDYDEVIKDFESPSRGPGGHAGPMLCIGPALANDLFLTSPGPFAVGFFGPGGGGIGGCAGSGVCDAFPAGLVNAFWSVPGGAAAVSSAVLAPLTSDFGWGCS